MCKKLKIKILVVNKRNCMNEIKKIIEKKFKILKNEHEKIEFINQIKLIINEFSLFKDNPVDCVIWVKKETVHANDYNPNSVASPEMELLKHSIIEDGYTQPIVTYPHDDIYEVVDGFHRNRVGKEYSEVSNKLHGYLPVVVIRKEQTDKSNRIASTIRHNRARGKHKVDSMSEIVIELTKRNWSDEKIAKNLGMDADEVLRLKQISGIEDAFTDVDFSNSLEMFFDSMSSKLNLDCLKLS